MKTKITELLGIEYPIVQGAMAWIAEHHLAAAVSKAGGLGIIAGGAAPVDYIRDEIRKARAITDKPLGMNIMLLSPNADDLAQLAIDEKIEVLTTGAGNPGKYMESWKNAGIKVMPVVASVALAKRMERAGADAVIAEYRVYADRLRPMVRDTTVMTWEAVKAGKEVLFEGAQGTLLDLDMGTYPFVTSSHPVAGGCCIGSGVGPTAITDIMGIFKSYTTRVGEGPFPTELFDETGDYIRNAGGEFGTVTGRPRRTGWFDAVIARYAVRVNGLTEAVINKIDPLRGLPKLKVCVAYKLKNGETVTEFPANFMDLVGCEPVYEEFDGFDEDITGCRSFDELPQTVQSYIKELERIMGCPITMLGVGPARDQVMHLD